MTESTIKINESENNFSEVEGVNLENSEKDIIHNTKTNLFVDEDKVVLDEEASPVTKKENTENYVDNKIKENSIENTELFLDNSEENKQNDTIVFKTSDEGVFNATEDTKLKEDKNDI